MSLSSEIQNIQVMKVGCSDPHSYRLGHRDARHGAAELSLKYERYIEMLEDYLDVDSLSELRKECGL